MIEHKIQVGDLVIGNSYTSFSGLRMIGGDPIGLVIGIKRMGKDNLVKLLVAGEVWTYPDCMLKHVHK